MTSIFEVLYCRRPVLNYVCPPVCEVLFSGSGFPVIVLGDFSSLSAPGGVRFGGLGGFRLSWNEYPGALCYNVYRAETDDPNAPLVLIVDCHPGTDIPLPPGCYRISAITRDGETALSPVVCYSDLPMLPPEVTTEAATNVLAASATLNGIINAIGQASTAYFEWGTTLAYGNTTPVQNTGDTFADIPFNAVITGLAPNGLYHYRAIGFNGSGEGDGVDMTFLTTGGGQPLIWDLVWTITEEGLGTPTGTLARTLAPDSFDLAMTQPIRPTLGGVNAVGDYLGTFSYTGDAQNCRLHLVVSNAGIPNDDFVHDAAITISVDGNPVLVVAFPEVLSNDGTYDLDFVVPESINALIEVRVYLLMGNIDHETHATWQGTLTTL